MKKSEFYRLNANKNDKKGKKRQFILERVLRKLRRV